MTYLEKDNRKCGDEREQPHEKYGGDNSACWAGCVLTTHDGPVSVERNHRDGPDGHHDVGSLEGWHHLAEDRAESPLSPQDGDECEGHADEAEGHVRDGQVHYVEVPRGVHGRSASHHEGHHQIGKNPDDHETPVDPDEDHLGERIEVPILRLVLEEDKVCLFEAEVEGLVEVHATLGASGAVQPTTHPSSSHPPAIKDIHQIRTNIWASLYFSKIE